MAQKFFGSIDLRDAQKVIFREADNVNFVSFRAPSTLAANTEWVWPGADGAAGALLKTDGAGNLSFFVITTSDVAEGSNQYFTVERAQDAVGAALTDTSSVDFTYDDTANTISAVVLPAGVNHDALQNYVANKHVDHSSVSITAPLASGLQGGGDLTASRTFVVDPSNATAKITAATADWILVADSTDNESLKKIPVQAILNLVTPPTTGFAADWVTADTSTKVVTHSLGTKDVLVQVYDKADDSTVYVDSVVRTSTNSVTLVSSSAPGASGWRVLVKKV
jgi:hypothetical protein